MVSEVIQKPRIDHLYVSLSHCFIVSLYHVKQMGQTTNRWRLYPRKTQWSYLERKRTWSNSKTSSSKRFPKIVRVDWSETSVRTTMVIEPQSRRIRHSSRNSRLISLKLKEALSESPWVQAAIWVTRCDTRTVQMSTRTDRAALTIKLAIRILSLKLQTKKWLRLTPVSCTTTMISTSLTSSIQDPQAIRLCAPTTVVATLPTASFTVSLSVKSVATFPIIGTTTIKFCF